jgi:hypothetical protein
MMLECFLGWLNVATRSEYRQTFEAAAALLRIADRFAAGFTAVVGSIYVCNATPQS